MNMQWSVTLMTVSKKPARVSLDSSVAVVFCSFFPLAFASTQATEGMNSSRYPICTISPSVVLLLIQTFCLGLIMPCPGSVGDKLDGTLWSTIIWIQTSNQFLSFVQRPDTNELSS